MGRKVLMLVSNEYRPDPRVHKEAKALIEGGYEVSVVAWDRERKKPSREAIEGVDLWRVRTGTVRSNAGLILNFPYFFLKSLILSKRLRPEIIHSHDLDTLPIGLLIARLRGILLVFDAHERYAKMIAIDVPGFVSRIVQALEDRLLPAADLVITVNDVMADQLRARAKAEVIVTMNCIDLPPKSMVKEHSEHDVLVILYPVALEPMHYIEESIEVAAKQRKCIMRVAGTGRLRDAVEKAAEEHSNIEYLGFMPHARLLEEYTRADIVLLLADPKNENYRTGTANKLGEAMAYGIPLICSKGILSGKFVEEADCGVTIDWSEENYVRAIDSLRDPSLRNSLGHRGREAAEKKLNWGLMKRRLNEAYSRMLSHQAK